ncbi:MAG TPA: hypothetical protein PKE06_14790 [Flavilitoribacter sp.]|nr:hypothetical protein [Flavilitoribacter sp.]HMQ89857.1 hypothetical protein [Flavilitoribacter sp.]
MIFLSEEGSIRTILNDTGVAADVMGLAPGDHHTSNLDILKSRTFENNLLLFIITGIITESEHYRPLMEEIDAVLGLIGENMKKGNE